MTFNISWIFKCCKHEKYVNENEVNVELQNPLFERLIWKDKEMKTHKGNKNQNDINAKSLEVLGELDHRWSDLAAWYVQGLFAENLLKIQLLVVRHHAVH